ncbi:MAG: threonine/serine dehydratase [Parvibaculaceae bacterium]
MTPGAADAASPTDGRPTTTDLLAARAFMARHYPPTPLEHNWALSRDHGLDVHVKLENLGPIRSFKARGALYRLSRLEGDERARGVVTASTGNHGQGVALAGRRLAIPAVVVVPEGTPRLKSDNIARLGAELRVAGRDLAEAEAEAKALAAATGRVFVEDGDDAGLMAGAGTIAWEILEKLPGADALVVPVGGGNLIAGMGLVARLLSPGIRIIGVQSEAAPAVFESWRRGRAVEGPCATFAGGLATARPGRLAFQVLAGLVDDMVLVTEAELRRAMLATLEATGQLAEGAGAAAFAALPALAPGLAGRKAVLLLSGGNVPVAELKPLFAA